MILRDDDDTSEWNGAGDGSFEQRTYLLQNWRADVVAILDSVGEPLEHVRYSPYGVPSSYPLADVNRDGLVDSDDYDDWDDMFTGGATNAKSPLDLNADGISPDTTDYDLFLASYHSTTGMRGGYNKLGATIASSAVISPQNRIGYAGYQWDPAIKQYHVRHRVYNAEVGRWLTRDPMALIQGSGMQSYVDDQPMTHTVQLRSFGWKSIKDSIENPRGIGWDELTICYHNPSSCQKIREILYDHVIKYLKDIWRWKWWEAEHGGTTSVHNAITHCTMSCVLRNTSGSTEPPDRTQQTEELIRRKWLDAHEDGTSCDSEMDRDNNDAGWDQLLWCYPNCSLADAVKLCKNRCAMLANAGRLVWLNPPIEKTDSDGNPIAPNDGLPRSPAALCPPGTRSSTRGCCSVVVQ